MTTEELPRPGSCEPFQLTAVSPRPDSRDVLPGVAMVATFNDFPDPETVNGTNLLLYTGFYYHTGRYWVDLVDRRALFKSTSNLRPGLGYTLVVKPGLRSLRGCRLQSATFLTEEKEATGYAFRFQIAADGSASSRLPAPVQTPPATFAQVMAVFGAHCAGGACHLVAPASDNASGACLPVPGGAFRCARRTRTKRWWACRRGR
ncbi:MAG: Ig-like domain-containing protein [Deltaproteobacteria bacterium]|nr:Ig-like domain-containing protein [Deltaproteobacteria bacterium]